MHLEYLYGHIQRPVAVVVACVGIALLSGCGDVAYAADDTSRSESSPFDAFPALEGYSDDEPRLDTDRELTPLDEDSSMPPDEPVELRIAVDEPLYYEIAGRLRIDVDDYDFQTDYRSALLVEYRPVSELRRQRLPRWDSDVSTEDSIADGQPMVARISDFSAIFEHPLHFRGSTYPHRLLQDARFSFRLDERGRIGDVHIHPPTNPVARATLEDVIRLLEQSHPALPEEPVAPGDTWSDTVELLSEGDSAEWEQRIETEYRFHQWVRCASAACAQIKVERGIDVVGQHRGRRVDTDNSADATARATVLVRPDDGRIISSHWRLSADTHTSAQRDDGESLHEYDSDVLMETAITATTR